MPKLWDASLHADRPSPPTAAHPPASCQPGGRFPSPTAPCRRHCLQPLVSASFWLPRSSSLLLSSVRGSPTSFAAAPTSGLARLRCLPPVLVATHIWHTPSCQVDWGCYGGLTAAFLVPFSCCADVLGVLRCYWHGRALYEDWNVRILINRRETQRTYFLGAS
jgi:hypothetical protein